MIDVGFAMLVSAMIGALFFVAGIVCMMGIATWSLKKNPRFWIRQIETVHDVETVRRHSSVEWERE